MTTGTPRRDVRGEVAAQSTASGPRRRGRQGIMARREAWAAYIFILPWIIGFVVFTAGPMVASMYFSLTDYNVLQPPLWVGLENYRQVVSDELFHQSLWNTIVYTLMYVPSHMAVALGLALLLTANIRGVPFWRTLFYIPSITPVVAVAILWRWLLNPNGGLVNRSLALVGIAGPGWTTDPDWMKPALVLMSLWSAGGAMLLYIAGLKNVPRELYEAAEIDGAGPVARFFRITLPMLSSVLFFTAIISVISGLTTFAQPAVLFDENGGSSNAALLYMMYLFNTAFSYFRMGYASALAWVLFVIVVAFTILQFRLSNRWVYYEGGDQ